MRLAVFILILLILSGCACTQKVRYECYENCVKQSLTRGVPYNTEQCGPSCAYQICSPF